MDKALKQAIAKVVADKTFSVEAVDAIKALRDDLKVKEELLKKAERNEKYLTKQIDELGVRVTTFESEAEDFTEERKRLAKRKEDFGNAETRALVAEAKLAGVMDVANLVFRNVEIRESIYGTVPVLRESSPGYTNVENHATSEEKTIKKE